MNTHAQHMGAGVPGSTTSPLTVVFCVPGHTFSLRFLRSWSHLLQWCGDNNVRSGCSIQYDPIVYEARNLCLGGDIRLGVDQVPFGGNIDYDYTMWIDSDMVFTPEQFAALLRHERDIVSGLYLMANGTEYATADPLQPEENGSTRRRTHLTPARVAALNGLISVPYTGFGFMLVRRGVLEALGYPWFRPLRRTVDAAEYYVPEDAAFCERAAERGFETLVDPKVLVGHEKPVVLG